MAIQQFDLLKKSAVTQIQTDLENAVEADRLLAQQASVDSVDAKDLSQAAQGLSEDARDKSEQWAENPENVEVEPGKYSALHHAAKSEKSSQLSEKWAEEAEDVEVEAGKYSSKHWAVKSEEFADDAQIFADAFAASYPVIPYRSRVIADSGVIGDLEKLTKLYIENLKLLDNTVFLWDGSAGMKTRTSGVNQYATKLYDMSAGNRDATQATEANQPFVGGGIAPNEKKRIVGMSNEQFVTFPKISLQNTGWAITLILNNKANTTAVVVPFLRAINAAKGQLRLQNNSLFYTGLDSGTVIPIFTQTFTNKSKNDIVTLVGVNGNFSTYRDGKLINSFSGVTLLDLEQLYTGIHTNVNHLSIFNKALSASEVQAQHAYLRLQHPEIEGINIGNQHWATSNYEGVVTGDGTIIPEVQDDAAWAALTTPAWCYYNDDPLNGAVYGKEYNLYGAQAINLNAPTGYTIGTYAQWLQMVTLLGGTSIAGNKMKLNGTALWAVGNVGTNESGFTALPNGQRNADGTFSQINNKANFWTSDGYLVTLDYNAATVTFTSGADAKIGAAIRLLRNEPVGDNERTITTGYITNALGVTNLDISIPFGYQVESVRIDSETNITGLSAKLLTGSLVELETLFTAKLVTANVQKVFSADADQSIQQTDAVVRINGTKADTTKRFRVWIKLTKVVFS